MATSPPLADRLAKLGTETAYAVSAETKKWEAENPTRKAFPFHIGDLNFASPECVIAATNKAMAERKTGYSPSPGTIELRTALASWYSTDRSLPEGMISPDNISVQPGGKIIIPKLILSVVNPREEVLLPSPGYPIYESYVDFVGAVAVPYPAYPLDVAALERLVTPRTRLLIINTPHNPLGMIYTAAELKAVAELAQRHNLWVLSDEAYFHIVYASVPQSERSIMGVAPEVFPRCVTLVTMSKSFAMTGWRAGCAVGPKPVIEAINRLNVNFEGCTTTFIQDAVRQCCTPEAAAHTAAIVKELGDRARVVYEGLCALRPFFDPGAVPPAGAFYAWAECGAAMHRARISDLEAFRRAVLNATGVSFCTRAHFGRPMPGAPNACRFAFSGVTAATAAEALATLAEHFRSLPEPPPIPPPATTATAPYCGPAPPLGGGRTKPRVYVTREIGAAGRAALAAAGIEFDVWGEEDAIPAEKFREVVASGAYDGVMPLLTERLDDATLQFCAQNGIRCACQVAVGYDNIDVAAAHRHGIRVSNTPGVLTETTAVSAVTLLLSAAAGVAKLDRSIRAGGWKVGWHPRAHLHYDLDGATVGIIGFGRIGQRAAELFRAFGARILYHDEYDMGAAAAAVGATRLPLHEVLRASDFVSLHLSLSSGKPVIGAEEFAQMRPHCVFVNTARGKAVDEAALVHALSTGQIAAAGLDVFAKEPLPKDSPLCALENVVLLPHVASASFATRDAMAELAARNVAAFFRGHKMPSEVLR